MGKTRAGRFALRGQRTALLHLETMTQAVDSADSVDPRALEALNRYFGYDSFRPGQSGIVSAILTGHDVLGVMPTGAGKSICYQIPAAILPGVAIVISPLISLMRDQVDALNGVGLPAAFINTTQTPDEQDLVFAQALSGQIKLLYVAPERLETERFRNFAVRLPIALVAVQIAVCESEKAVSLVKGSEWQDVFTFQINHFAAGHQLYFANGFTGDAKQIVAGDQPVIVVSVIFAELADQRKRKGELLEIRIIKGEAAQTTAPLGRKQTAFDDDGFHGQCIIAD